MSTLTNAFQMLVKDKDIIAAEVMHEYDEKVNPFPHPEDPLLTAPLSSSSLGSILSGKMQLS